MPACLCISGDIESNFHHCGGPVKLVQVTLGVRKDVESSFHHCGGPVMVVQERHIKHSHCY